MSDIIPIRTALISVSDKTGLVEFGQALVASGAAILSTGGSAKTLREAGVPVTEVSEHTGFPEILEGRVKTLVPQVHGGILGKRHDPSHIAQMAEHGIAPIDLVAVNLYPFEATVARGAEFDDCIENIDIGGPAMIRSAAKNHEGVTVLTEPAHYARVLKEISTHGGTTLATRRALAASAYARTAAYDAAISAWFAAQLGETYPDRVSVSGAKKQELRYGENPHQSAAFYTSSPARFGVATATQHQGKELSYNNYNDTDAAFECVAEFDEPTVVIVKHANPCGVATALNLADAWDDALACDPVSAFGGIVAVNRALDEETAAKIATIFTEVIIAPEATGGAKSLLAAKKNLRLLTTGGVPSPVEEGVTFKSLAGGFLVQSRDAGRVSKRDLKIVTRRAPTDKELEDMLFAFRVAKHVKSNAIVYAKKLMTLGIGAGQMNRVDSARIAAWRGKNAGLDFNGCAVASDAFFPFADGLEAAIAAGASCVIQPGGSIRDKEVIEAADKAGIAMVFTNMRHFRH
ncbi:MAG: bifunctional phosphoribosylaminoimidazolecarboxamide formyltransferase/IMP cyclohydrolase [Proteobacteria bacterium]|nr:bifunctional phosphoribosylaminoimidazolecarboxamide formyltransferase/IMP cyclohydrolase [Pseudomonadota bacterium]MBU6426600.1 bifunctional phosphoribosylaminoimidazolecarboxamide formyltransferase/IMP cyclohydrolase [Rhodospirillales bacterium]